MFTDETKMHLSFKMEPIEIHVNVEEGISYQHILAK